MITIKRINKQTKGAHKCAFPIFLIIKIYIMNLKSAKIKKRTTNITLYSENKIEVKEILALSLLMGAYNSLRKHSQSGQPICEDVLKVYQDKFSDLIYQVMGSMDINTSSVEEL